MLSRRSKPGARIGSDHVRGPSFRPRWRRAGASPELAEPLVSRGVGRPRSDPGAPAAAPVRTRPPPVLRQLPSGGWSTRTASRSAATIWRAGSTSRPSCSRAAPRSVHASLPRCGQLERRYREEGVEEVRLVSFTVDPAHDTPERLRDYARSRSLDLERWSLLTGAEPGVRSVVVDGFALPMGERPGPRRRSGRCCARGTAGSRRPRRRRPRLLRLGRGGPGRGLPPHPADLEE